MRRCLIKITKKDEVDVYIESIEEVSVVEESVGEEEVEEHDEQVENFAEDEPAEIYVVPEKKYMLFLREMLRYVVPLLFSPL